MRLLKTLKGLDSVTISAAYNTLRNFTFGLGVTLGIAHIQELPAVDMVKMKGSRMFSIAAIYATHPQLVFIKPAAKHSSSVIGKMVQPFAVCRISQACLTPPFALGWLIDALPRFAIGLFYFIWIAFTPAARCFSLFVPSQFIIHDRIIPQCEG